ncbi:MAG: DNA-directed RNA polymerase subunit omega [Acidobacteriota bacterium]|nr:DNA-directed RNA polymerase subunit omega [Acidobacteriota bacterium]
METFGNVDSKFRFIILASKRAKQILKGAKPKIELKSRNAVRIAQAEIMENLVEYEILPLTADDSREPEDRVLGEDGIPDDIGDGDADDHVVAGAGDDDVEDEHPEEDPAADSEDSDEDD